MSHAQATVSRRGADPAGGEARPVPYVPRIREVAGGAGWRRPGASLFALRRSLLGEPRRREGVDDGQAYARARGPEGAVEPTETAEEEVRTT